MTQRCARWCGRGCTQEEYERACGKARLLVKGLGAGWKPHVWENLGWHWEVIYRGIASVMESGSGFLSLLVAGSRYVGRGRTPRAAVRNLRAQIQRERDRLDAILDGIGEP